MHEEGNDVLEKTPTRRIYPGKKVTPVVDMETTNATEGEVLPLVSKDSAYESNEATMGSEEEDVDEIESIVIIPLSEILKQYKVKRLS